MKTDKARSFNMSRIGGRDTKIEIILRQALWDKGYRYRKNDKSVTGKPDICFKKKKVAVFCDSSFWHGKDFREGKIPVNNREFWTEKLQGNIERDKKVNKILETQGWKVLRFWDTEILNNLDQCLEKIEYELGKTPEN